MLLALGLSHKTAPIEIREKLAFSPENIPNALRALAQQLPVSELALLSTCNRTEFYCSTFAYTDSFMEQVLCWWQAHLASPFDMTPYMYTFVESNAVKHVMRVASGLDSMILGESQILGQMKTAYETAHQSGVVGKRLSKLFQTSFSVAKKVRHETGINTHPVSVAYAAVSLAKQIFSDLSKATVLLIGAGENIELTIQHLAAKKISHIIIANRTICHAQQLAGQYNAKVLPLTELEEGLKQADIVISSVDCEEPVLTYAHIEKAYRRLKRKPVLMVDLGVPRNIEPQIGYKEDIYLYTIDDLQGIITENLKNRELAAQEAEIIIEKASHDFMHWFMTQQQQTQVIQALRVNAEEIKAQLLKLSLHRLEKGEDPKAVLVQFAHQLTQKLLHQPTLLLKNEKIK